MKTILKLHANGDFETIDTELIQNGISGNYKFAENAITVPRIIEYPPASYRNYFIEKTSSSGYVSQGGNLYPPDQDDRVSDFISVSGWGNGNIRARFENMHGEYRAWVGIVFFNVNKQFLSIYHDDYVAPEGQKGDYAVEIRFPANVAYIRVSINYYDSPITSVKLSVEKGTIATAKHYLAPEDMPEWVRDTGQPISIFLEGIVIKGALTQS